MRASLTHIGILFGTLLSVAAQAVEVPNPLSPFEIQTNSPDAAIGLGDWYTANTNGQGSGYHYFSIHVPEGWPDSEPLHIDLFSAPMVTNTPLDEDNGNARGTTTFELYDIGTVVSQPATPGPGAAGSLGAQSYPPQPGPPIWRRAFTLPAPVAAGRYILRSEATSDDQNGWRVHVGRDDDNDPNNARPTNNDDFDRVPGTDDEVIVGIIQAAWQHSVGGGACLTLYEFIPSTLNSITFNNFDMDNNQRVRYYSPIAELDTAANVGGIVGTVSGNTDWNNGGTQTARAGDTVFNTNPLYAPGWWGVVSCLSDNNQFIQEGPIDTPAFDTEPPTPEIVLLKDDNVLAALPGQQLTYTIRFDNISDQNPAPSAAKSLVLTDVVPDDTSYVSCGINPPYTGSCGLTGNTVRWDIDQTVFAGQQGSITLTVDIDLAASFPIDNRVDITYTDSHDIGTFTAFATERTPSAATLQMVKTADVTNANVGDTITYDYELTNTSVDTYFRIDSLSDNKIGPVAVPSNISAAVVRYGFDADATDTIVEDTSPLAPAADLTIANRPNTTYVFNPSGLVVNDATRLAGSGAKLAQQCTSNNQITVEAWIDPENVTQSGPARIITQSSNGSNRNFTLGQDAGRYEFRLRTTTNGNNGTNTVLQSPVNSVTTNLTHVVATRAADGLARLYLDGQIVDTETIGGDLSNWDTGFQIGLANEFGVAATDTARDWRGTYFKTAVYCDAFSPSEVAALFEFGSEFNFNGDRVLAPGESTVVQATYVVQPDDFPGPVVNVATVNATNDLNESVIAMDDESVDLNPAVLAISKSSRNLTAPGDVFAPGDEVEYTITVSNPTGVTQTNVVIGDSTPLGTTYVAQSTVVTGRNGVDYADNFSSRSYDNIDGTNDWTSDWIESGGDAGGSPTAGGTEVSPGGELEMQPASSSATDRDHIERAANLTGISNAVLTFDWRGQGDQEDCDFNESTGTGFGADDCGYVHLDLGPVNFDDTNTADGDGRYIRFDSFTPISLNAAASCTDNGTSGSCSINIPASLAASTFRVGFAALGYVGTDEFLFFDNIRIDGAAIATLDNVPGGTNADLAQGATPTLAVAADRFSMLPGGTVTAIWRATIDDPRDPDQSVVRNLASADSDQAPPAIAEKLDPLRARGSIGDQVFIDIDRDGVFDVGEAGLANVTLALRDAGNNIIGTAVTAADGRYLFDRLPPGTYSVEVDLSTVPSGLVPTAGNTNPRSSVVIAGSTDRLDIDFGYTAPDTSAVIGDLVWLDADGDGIRDAGEPGIGNVTVELRDAQTGAVVASQTTAADGSYLFTGVADGEYVVAVTDNNAALGGFTVTTGGTQSSPIAVRGGDVALDADFGFRPQGETRSITDRVWLDADFSQFREAGEPGIDGVSVNLLDNNGIIIATTVTGPDGSFTFTGLVDGDYTVELADNFGRLSESVPTTGPANARSFTYTVTGVDVVAENFGFAQPGVIGDTVFSDASGDGLQDSAEAGIPGVTVELWQDTNGDGLFNRSDDTLIDTAITDAAGRYQFNGLGFGRYFASVDDSQTALSGYTGTSVDEETGVNAAGFQDRIALGPNNGGYLDADFGFRNTALADVSGNVFEDLDVDGIDDGASEPGFAQVSVDLLVAGPDGILGTLDDQIVARTRTDAVGDYQFSDVPAGPYRVRVSDVDSVLSGFRLTSGTDFRTINVASQDITGIDFGYVGPSQTATIGDRLWLDADADGNQDPGEPGLPGATIRLLADSNGNGVLDGGDQLLSTTTTAGDGRYDFGDLPAGNYFAEVDQTTLPAGLRLTGGTSPTSRIVLSDGEDYNLADFGYASVATRSVFGDQLWVDADGNGIFDAGEAGLAGVTVTVTLTTGPDAGLQLTVDTGPDGRWLVTDVPPGDYRVDFDTNDIPNYLDPTPTNADFTYELTAIAGRDYLLLDWGFEPLGNGVGRIGDRVFFDVDGDGLEDTGEPGIGGVDLALRNDQGELVASTVTASDGSYRFTGLPPGDYTVEVIDSSNLLAARNQTTADPGAITLAAGQIIDTIDYGYSASGGSGAIGSLVWHDRNGDGARDAGEDGMENVTVDLWIDVDNDGLITAGVDNRVRRATTDANGEYQFLGVPPDNYLVSVSDINQVTTGFANTTGTPNTDNQSQLQPFAISLQPGASVMFADFGYTAPNGNELAISGNTFIDSSNDGVRNGGEVATRNVTLLLFRDLDNDGELDDTDALIGVTLSDANGNYLFDDLPSGSYIVVADTQGSQVNGYQQTTQSATAGVQPVTLANANSGGNDFGFNDLGVSTTPVSLAWFRAYHDGARTVFEWTTATGERELGFHAVRAARRASRASGRICALASHRFTATVDLSNHNRKH